MAASQSLAGDAPLFSRIDNCAPGPERSLDAVRALAGAGTAGLLTWHRSSGQLNMVASVPAKDTAFPARLIATMTADAHPAFNDAPLHWLPEADGRPGATLLLRVPSPGSTMFLLALGFENASPLARARIARQAGDLVTLVAYHVSVHARMRELEERCAATTESLDHGECGVIAVREDRSVVFANEAALAHFEEDAGLRVRRGLVRAIDRADAIRFEAALDAVIEPAGGGERRRGVVMLLSRKAGRPTIVSISPARRDALSPSRAKGAAAMIYVLQPDGGQRRGLETLCRLHGLSRVESRLLMNLIAGRTLTETAADMRIKTETARAYLKQVFAKTGIRRQTELVSLMSRYLRALRGNFEFEPA